MAAGVTEYGADDEEEQPKHFAKTVSPQTTVLQGGKAFPSMHMKSPGASEGLGISPYAVQILSDSVQAFECT